MICKTANRKILTRLACAQQLYAHVVARRWGQLEQPRRDALKRDIVLIMASGLSTVVYVKLLSSCMNVTIIMQVTPIPCHHNAMGWLQLVGSLKLQVSFAKEPYKRDDILQKRPIFLRSLPIVVTP